MARLKVFTDGASRGNPGESGIGIIIYDDTGKIIKKWNEYTGKTTNNQAEYSALLKSIQLIEELNQAMEIEFIEFNADSELMIKQLKKQYKVKDAGLKQLYNSAIMQLSSLKIPHAFKHVERSLNKEADKLANQGIDNKNSI
ncbi:MAG: ribonuclease HI family protein [Ignavibacteria bacterium]|nr:ribonuclease HI family protein [Ignavibacteria bacterium]MCC7158382.1 ribonuclease HI family protein [Ignavibacteria bacterium]